MATAVIMPRQGQSVESCIIGKWHKQEGDPVKTGDLLFTYETDKATFDEAAKTDGTILAVFFEEGDDVPVLTNVCVIGEPGEDYSQYNPVQSAEGKDDAAVPGQIAETADTRTEDPADAAASESDFNQNHTDDGTESEKNELPAAVSPRARKLAERSGADLRLAVPSGPKGRVIERDVQRLIEQGALATQAAGSDYDIGISGSGIGGRVSVGDIAAGKSMKETQVKQIQKSVSAGPESYTEKHSNIRKVIARSMQSSLSQMAQLTLNSSFDASDIMELRKRLKAAGEKGLNATTGFVLAEKVPTLNDIILYAVSRTLSRHAACNAHYDEEKMTYFNRVHMGVAVDTPRGLMVPTIFNSDLMTLAEISAEVKDSVAACQEGTISPDRLRGGTFTVTNMGTLGVESFTPVINPPQTCILGVCSITNGVREINGELKTYPSMGLSLTFDHRALDGAPAARFLKDLKLALENFSLLMLQ